MQLYKSYMNFLTHVTGMLKPHRCHYVSWIRNVIGYTGTMLCNYIGQQTKTDQYPCHSSNTHVFVWWIESFWSVVWGVRQLYLWNTGVVRVATKKLDWWKYVEDVLDLVIQKKVELNRSLKWVSYKHQVLLLPCSVRFFSEEVLLHDQWLEPVFSRNLRFFHMNVLLQFMRLLLYRFNIMPLTINR
jgi:hypothetical protein